MTTAENSLPQPEPNDTTKRSPLFEQAIAVTRAYADRLREDAARLAEHEELLVSARLVLKGFAAGVFVRNIADDDRSDWAIRALPHITALARLEAAVKKAALVLAFLFIASSAHAADRTPLVSLLAASVADAVTTERAIHQTPYAYEANPVLSGSLLQREATKAACTAGLVWGLARLSHQYPMLARALAWSATGSLAVLAAHNAAIGGR